MIRLLKLISFFLVSVLVLNCSPTSNFTIIKNDNMEKTIMIGAKIEYATGINVKRGDIVVINTMSVLGQTASLSCYRVVGLPGDVISIYKNDVFVNNKKIKRPSSAVSMYEIVSDSLLDPIIGKFQFRLNDSSCIYSMTIGESQTAGKVPQIRSVTELVENPEIYRANDGFFIKHDSCRLSYLQPIKVPEMGDKRGAERFLPLIGYVTTPDNLIRDDYYFLINDDFFTIPDSRSLGLFPKDSIVGVVKNIYNSTRKSVKIDAR